MINNREQIVRSTKEGKLYIKPSDLFRQKEVQDLLEKALKSEALANVKRVTLKTS